MIRLDRIYPGNFHLLCWPILLYGGMHATWTLDLQGAEGSWTETNSWRFQAVEPFPAERPSPGFTLMPREQLGVAFTNQLSKQKASENHNLLNGSGVALGDVNNDGLCDIYFCGLESPNALYLNKGDWTFEEITEQAGVGCPDWFTRGAAFADVDGDSDLDLLVTGSGTGTRLFLNNGEGMFELSSQTSLAARTGSTTLALADVDNDGDLDLYVTNYGENTIRSGLTVSTRIVNGKEVIVGRYRNRLKIINGRLVEYGEPDVFYRNDGQGNFTPVSWTDGNFLDEQGSPLTKEHWDLGLSGMFRDINQDGDPDIYVCNDFQDPDRIWINRGDGTFQALPRHAIRSTCHFSMGADFADINRDGWDDLMVVDMLSRSHELRMTQIKPDPPEIAFTLEEEADRPQYRRNMLYLNRGDGTYAEIAYYASVAATDWSWDPVFLDVDLDGYEDLLVITGHAYDTQNLDTIQGPDHRRSNILSFPPLKTPNMAFRNQQNLTFAARHSVWGFDSEQVSNGIAVGDLDLDGDQDLVLACLNSPPLIYRNNASAPRIAVRLRSSSGNTQGIGARVTLRNGELSQSQEIVAGGRHLSCDEPSRTFAVPDTNQPVTIEVRWRDGKITRIQNARSGHIYEIFDSGNGLEEPKEPQTFDSNEPPLFADVSDEIGHTHQSQPFDDFARQSSLPRSYSTLGPGIAWSDLDGDGWDDLVIGAGRDGSPAVFLNQAGKGFRKTALSDSLACLKSEQAGLAFPAASQLPDLLAFGPFNYKENNILMPSLRSLKLLDENCTGELPARSTTTGPVAFADVNKDGRLDGFVGGRFVPGKYPESADSLLFSETEDGWIVDAKASEVFREVGLISGAVFTDLNNDTWPDLVLACEWDAIRIFLNERGLFRDVTETFGIGHLKGWWTSVIAADVNNDNRMDLVAGNWGLNGHYSMNAPYPKRIYFGDLDQNGVTEILHAYYDPGLGDWVPWHQLDQVAESFPFVRGSFPNNRSFRNANVREILGHWLDETQLREANHLATTVFLNTGDNRLEAIALPAEAQWSPVFGIVAADFNGDGFVDLFCAQNFFETRKLISRNDSGRGLLLFGLGNGSFEAVPGRRSNVVIYTQQRGAAVADFNHDARADLAVATANDKTRLLRNQTGQPGVRVEFSKDGDAKQRPLIGTRLRLGDGTNWGSTHEISAGNGYWSQDSFQKILTCPNHIHARLVEIQWPDGKREKHKVSQDSPHSLLIP